MDRLTKYPHTLPLPTYLLTYYLLTPLPKVPTYTLLVVKAASCLQSGLAVQQIPGLKSVIDSV